MSSDVEERIEMIRKYGSNAYEEDIALLLSEIKRRDDEIDRLKAENAKMVEAGFREGIRMGRATCGVQTPQPIADRMWHLSEARKGLE